MFRQSHIGPFFLCPFKPDWAGWPLYPIVARKQTCDMCIQLFNILFHIYFFNWVPVVVNSCSPPISVGDQWLPQQGHWSESLLCTPAAGDPRKWGLSLLPLLRWCWVSHGDMGKSGAEGGHDIRNSAGKPQLRGNHSIAWLVAIESLPAGSSSHYNYFSGCMLYLYQVI